MTGRENLYDLDEVNGGASIKYIFISTGESDIVKAVAYDYVQELKDAPLYNLGFGDYDIAEDKLDDTSNSNNGDMYDVFHTVLSTVPRFFELNPHATMVVQGSDHSEKFLAKCKETCKKKCEDSCRNLNRRIKTYRYFVDKNYEKLRGEYTFWGGTRTDNGIVLHDNYEIGTEYDLVFCKRNVVLQNED
jgi:hypothetical protein